MSGRILIAWSSCILCFAVSTCRADEAATTKPNAQKYLLRYHFHDKDTLRWNVINQCQIQTAVAESTQNAETTTTSTKVWRVVEVKPDGTTKFEHLVEDIDMRHRLTGRDEVHYNSRKDLHAPPGFENVAQAVGVTLSVITIDNRGRVLARQQNPVKASVPTRRELTIPLPEEAIAVGHRWSCPHDIDVVMPEGGSRRIKTLKSMTLEEVKTGVAVIRVDTQILTPIDDPGLESQLIQDETSGTVRFDIEAGQVLGLQMDVDKSVVGFRGHASSVHYYARSVEEFLPTDNRVAARTSHGE